MGVGEQGRLYLAAAREAGIEVGSFVFSETGSRQNHVFDDAPATDLNINLVAVNADQLLNFATEVGPDFFTGRYTIGAWAWEIEEFPDHWPEAFALVDEIWTSSNHSRRAIAAMTGRPVFALPLPVVPPPVDPHLTRSDFGLPDGYLFLFCFDFLSVVARKNPAGLIAAFSDAFSPGDGPILVVKTINGDQRPTELQSLQRLVRGRSDIVLLDGYLDRERNGALMNLCDCYVSLHRSEGFGLTMAEAMALGKPVIATGYSGNLDYMDHQTAYLVPSSPARVPDGCFPYPAGGTWAEPNLPAAASLMRRVAENPAEAADLGVRARSAVMARHGLSARCSFIRERYNHAQRALADGLAHGPGQPTSEPPAHRGIAGKTGWLDAASREHAPECGGAKVGWALANVHLANDGVTQLTWRLIRARRDQRSMATEVLRLRNKLELVRSERDAISGSRAYQWARSLRRLRSRVWR